MEIDYTLPPVKYALLIVKRIDKEWNNIENSQEAVDKKQAGIFDDKETRTVIVYLKQGLKPLRFRCSKTEWIWYKFFKKLKLGLK